MPTSIPTVAFIWDGGFTSTASGAEESEAILYLWRSGTLTPIMKIDSSGTLELNVQSGTSSTWRTVAFLDQVPGNSIIADPPIALP